MATYTIIKLKDMSPLHMGTGKENYDFSASQLHSDTLSAALVAMKVRHGNIENIAIIQTYPGDDFLHINPFFKCGC